MQEGPIETLCSAVIAVADDECPDMIPLAKKVMSGTRSHSLYLESATINTMLGYSRMQTSINLVGFPEHFIG